MSCVIIGDSKLQIRFVLKVLHHLKHLLVKADELRKWETAVNYLPSYRRLLFAFSLSEFHVLNHQN